MSMQIFPSFFLNSQQDISIVFYCRPKLFLSCLNHISFGMEQPWKGYGVNKKNIQEFLQSKPMGLF